MPLRVGIAPPYFFCRIVPLVPPNNPTTQAAIETSEMAFAPDMLMRGITTTNSPNNPSINPETARALSGSPRYLAAKRLTNTGCKLTINAVTPAGNPRLTAKKQPPK